MKPNSPLEIAGINPKILFKIGSLAIIFSTSANLIVTSPAFSHEARPSSSTLARERAVSLNSGNHRPVARPDFVDLNRSALAINVLANDFDADGDRLTLLTATAKFGAVAFTPDGLLAYAQEVGQFRPDKITYTVTDGRGGEDIGYVEILAR